MKKRIAAFSFLFVLQTLSAQSQSSKAAQRIDSLLRTIYQDSLPGISIGILQNGNVLFQQGYGIKDIQSRESITTGTNFNIASLTKQFTALAILQLAEKNKLSLQDKLSRFLPDMNRSIADSITIRQLLTHISGLYDHYEYVDTKKLRHGHDSNVYNAVKNIGSLYFKPGTRFRYSNTSYCFLALVIEKVSGLPYNEYMRKYIFQPAGMKGTRVWKEAATILREATGYDKDSATGHFVPSGPDEHIFFSTEGDGGIYTSIHDYLLWLKALNGAGVFSRTITDEARSLHFAIRPEQKLGYGFGWFVDDNGPDKKVYHSGDNGGFRTYSFTMPEQGFAIIVFSNRSDISVEHVVEKIYRILYPSKPAFIKIEAVTS